jgi:hypothetical protein
MIIFLLWIIPALLALLFPWLELPKGSTISDLIKFERTTQYAPLTVYWFPIVNMAAALFNFGMYLYNRGVFDTLLYKLKNFRIK